MSGSLEIVVITVTAKIIISVESRYLLWLYHVKSLPLSCFVTGLEYRAHI